MTRQFGCVGLGIVGLILTVFAITAPAQTVTSAGPEFDVASIKPSEQSTVEDRRRCLAGRLRLAVYRRLPASGPAGRWVVGCGTLREIVAAVYPDYAQHGRILEGPDWVDDLRFDIEAHADEHASREQLRSMAARLLADRFQLQLERETRSMNAYALVVARPGKELGPGLRPAVDCERQNAKADSPVAGARPPCRLAGAVKNGVATISGGAATIEELIGMLQLRMDGPIVDRTGLTGEFAITFDVPPFAPAGFAPADSGLPPVSSEMSTAIREQLGLNLVPRKEETPVLIIKHVEKPTSN